MKDLEKVYDEQISPLMSEIIGICKANGMPMVATFQYKDRPEVEGEYLYCTTVLPLEEFSPMLKDVAYRIKGKKAFVTTMTVIGDFIK